MAIDVTQLIAEIIDALRNELGDGFSAIATFSERQTKMLATQAAFITQSRVEGSLRSDTQLFDFFVEQLAEMTRNFIRAVAELTILTIEKAWNAVVNVLWSAVNAAIGAAGFAPLPLPSAPAASV